jgi:hypothetical protein
LWFHKDFERNQLTYSFGSHGDQKMASVSEKALKKYTEISQELAHQELHSKLMEFFERRYTIENCWIGSIRN